MRISIVSGTVGSPISIFWKRRARARSRSNEALYSPYVVEPMQRSFPEATAGLRMFEASIVPPLTAPAPTIVWISSMKRIASFFSSSAAMTAFKRCSNSPRYFVPASTAPMSSDHTSAFFSTAGTSLRWIFSASPSAIAVLPTPGSPTKSGLFFRRRQRIWIVRSSSGPRPISGSISPFLARSLRFTANAFSGSPIVCGPSSSGVAKAGRGTSLLAIPCERKFSTSILFTPCERRR